VHSDISLLPLLDAYRLTGVLVFVTEATEHARLKEQMGRIAEQHATAIEELQSTNEELETTNEELQSTNEELETTNEELQSTNEELETTVEELQAANTELAALNSELEGRTAELNRLDAFHRSLINSLDHGLAVLTREGVVLAWNQVAETMWGLRAEQTLHRPFFALPIGDITERAHGAFERVLATGEHVEVADVTYALPGGSSRRGTLRMLPLKNVAGEVAGVLAVMASDSAPTRRA
jgi:two-component system CheB/CheR fusion protein